MRVRHSTASDATFSTEGAGAWDADHTLENVWTELEVDFGTKPVYDATFQITDAAITATSKVVVMQSGKTATGRASGDMQWDAVNYAANADDGFATCYALCSPGPIVGRRILYYQVI